MLQLSAKRHVLVRSVVHLAPHSLDWPAPASAYTDCFNLPSVSDTSYSILITRTSAAMSRIRIGIIGYGNSARVFHLPYIERNPDLEVVAFLQRAEPRAGGRHCKHDYPTARWHRTIDEFCADDNIDLGIVVTGHSSHAELAEKVVLSGKHGEPRRLSHHRSTA
jgi:hypothetical protein